jgi:hypothetical protein
MQKALVCLMVLACFGCADTCVTDACTPTLIDGSIMLTNDVAFFTARVRFDSGPASMKVASVPFVVDGQAAFEPQLGPVCNLGPHDSCEGVWTGAVPVLLGDRCGRLVSVKLANQTSSVLVRCA